mmetsp:Transcript_15159/g.23070  ORF Transcript_15159/g.23070 Transcript_15159/m.23070 type:complete len:95 (+) Transcript_15159:147-431(+)
MNLTKTCTVLLLFLIPVVSWLLQVNEKPECLSALTAFDVACHSRPVEFQPMADSFVSLGELSDSFELVEQNVSQYPVVLAFTRPLSMSGVPKER